MFYPRLQECLQDVLVDMRPRMMIMMAIGDLLLSEETQGNSLDKWNV